MRIKPYLFSILLGAIFFASCQRNAVTLSYTNAKGEVPQLGNLVFRFNQALATDSMLNAWDSSEYISFDPAIRGRFRWESPDELVFSPSEPLQPATAYTAKLKNAVLKYSKYDAVRKSDKISFHTAPLTLGEARVVWIGESSTTAYPQVDLYFNYIVDPEDLGSKLDIEVEGKDAEFTAITASAENKISYRVNGIRTEDRDIPLSIEIEKGLRPEKGNTATDEAISRTIMIPSPFVLGIQKVQAEHDGVEGVVRVNTSQQLTGENIRSFVTISPAVNFTVEPDDFGFTIRSADFDTERAFALTIEKGLRGKIGGVLKEEYNEGIGFGELEANIRFTSSKAVYLSKKGSGNVEIQVTNVPKVKLIISRIYENNLLFARQYGYEPRENRSGPDYASYGEDEYYYDEYSYGEKDAVLGDVIYEKEIDTRSLPKSGIGRLLNLNRFEDRLPDFNGVYHVMIRSTEDYWVRDSRFISLSDIGLIAREGKDKIYVFANSIKTAEALKGVNVSVYARNNQLIGTGSTNGEGVAEITYARKEMSGFKPALMIAKSADDFNYLPFAGTKVNTSRFEVGGKRDNPSGLDAFVYAERDLYRPGEKISYSVVVRDGKWKAPGDMMLKLKFLLPNGKELRSFRKSLNEEGAMEGSMDISQSAITGVYTLEVYTSNDILLSSKYFSVEEFVPDRLKVNAKLDRENAKPAETVKLSINATNFFGPPAGNRKVETEIQVRQLGFSPEGFEDYNFSLSNHSAVFDKEVREATTNEAGNVELEYTVPDIYLNMGALQTNFYATVFDETGRPVSRAANLKVYTQPVFFGVKQDWFYYYPLNQAVKFPVIALNKDGKKVSAQARVELIKHEYKTVLTKSGSYFRYESQREDKMMMEGKLEVSNNTVFTYVPRSPGDYEMRIYVPGASNYVSRSFYSYGSWGGDNNSFEVNNEGNIDIEIDKRSYFTGESVKALFKTPFSGRLLVTLETDHVVSYQYVDVINRSASLDLKLSEEHLPNVYITATLVKPHEVSDIPLTVAHGFKNLEVEAKDRKIDVKLTAQKNVRSKTRQKITVKAAPNSYVSLAAVDNGVLQVNDYKTPDPYAHFYEKKALQVSSYDIYPLLFAEVRAKMSSTGGDQASEDMKDRVNPLAAKRINVVSYWGGLKKTNGSGIAEYTIDVPQFSGELRLMAVSFKGDRFGAGEETMVVADPVVISTALPRFLSPGDTVNVPVTLTNTTTKNESVTASIAVEGPMKVVGSNQQRVQLGSKQESRAMFRIVADPAVNIGKITVTVSGMSEKFTDATEISVRPPSTLQKRTMAGSINGGSTRKIPIAVNDFMPASVKYSLVVSRSPAVQFADQLKYLVQYPYGCTEQVISSAFPQLYYGDMADLMQLNKQQNKLNANTNILEAIRKIQLRQLYNGAVTLWDGEGQANWWTTIYAAHFLLEARKAGFEVDNSLVETMIGYLNSRLKNRETINYYYNRDKNKKIAPKEVSYSLYVLAIAGRTNVPAMNYYKANQQLLALDSRYLLAAAYATAGDKRSFNAMLPGSFEGEESVPQTGGSFYSDVRDEAIALNALLDVDPGNAQVGTMVKHVAEKLKAREYLSTQERSFSFLALGKHARRANASNVTADIKMNGKTIAKIDGGEWRGDQSVMGGNNVEISTKGSGHLYYFWEASGISATGAYREEDSYLRARRQFYDRNGKLITSRTFKQNDLVIIGISVEKSFSAAVENVVITDLLPAGFEIENPRTKEIPGMDWIRDGSTPTALDVRDDRIHFFVDLTSPKQTYYYAVRAESPGNFRMGPVSADAMYNGEYHSYHGAGWIRIE
jgi:uncharacterized protein YfaS (alpha-2-macroglobulin family)